MAKFCTKTIFVEAITFDEFVAYGIANGGNVVNGMPWSFSYKDRGVTHEDDNSYLICSPDALGGIMEFRRGDMLVTDRDGNMSTCSLDVFECIYEPSNIIEAGPEFVAAHLYTRYCKAVGGVAFNGDPLPTWEQFVADPEKAKQVAAWIAVGEEANRMLESATGPEVVVK